MESKINPWKANLTNGVILALVGITYSLILYFMDKSTDKNLGYLIIVIQIGVLFFLLKSYRDNIMHGQITYGQSVGSGVIISLYSAIATSIFTYILYTVIDPGLVAKQLAVVEEGMRAKGGMSDSQIDTAMQFTAKFMSPVVMAISGVFGGILWGTIISLLVSIFIKKEGNPLVDLPENQG
jgi:hypothetical protein